MRIVIFMATASILFGFSSAGVAQDPTGSPARQAQDIFNVDIKESDYFEVMFRNPGLAADTYANALRFGSCAAKMNQAPMRSLLAADAGSDAEMRAIRDLSRRFGACVVQRTSVSPLLIRGAIAETLWKAAGANPNPAKRSSIGIEDIEVFIRAAPLGERKTKAADLPLSVVSRCQVMAMPTQSAKVLAAPAGSKEEQAAAEALYAASKICGVTKGLGKTLSIAVRAGLADAFYQDAIRVAPVVR
jgi:hypothetical protein